MLGTRRSTGCRGFAWIPSYLGLGRCVIPWWWLVVEAAVLIGGGGFALWGTWRRLIRQRFYGMYDALMNPTMAIIELHAKFGANWRHLRDD